MICIYIVLDAVRNFILHTTVVVCIHARAKGDRCLLKNEAPCLEYNSHVPLLIPIISAHVNFCCCSFIQRDLPSGVTPTFYATIIIISNKIKHVPLLWTEKKIQKKNRNHFYWRYRQNHYRLLWKKSSSCVREEVRLVWETKFMVGTRESNSITLFQDALGAHAAKSHTFSTAA